MLLKVLNIKDGILELRKILKKELKSTIKERHDLLSPIGPYKLVYKEAYKSKTEARKREIKVKNSGIIRKTIKNNINSGPIV